MNFNRMSDETVLSMHDASDGVFGKWKHQVNRVCIAHFGLSSDDLPDACWRDYHEGGMTPVEAIDCAVMDVWGIDSPELETLWYGE